MDEIIRLGRDASKIYYHQGDWTHTNDYGAVRVAGYAADELRSLGEAFPDYLPLIQTVSASSEPWKPEAALLLEKPARLAGVKDPNGTEEGTAAQDHQAEKDGCWQRCRVPVGRAFNPVLDFRHFSARSCDIVRGFARSPWQTGWKNCWHRQNRPAA